jgi:hypothetical protein
VRVATALWAARHPVRAFKAARRNPKLAWLRALPDFLIIGAMRSGTTSLYYALTQHPRVVPPGKKEIHFFNSNYERGPDWYRTWFPLRAALVGGKMTFEATTFYLFDKEAPARARSVIPDARFIAILRDPVARAVSHYYHSRRWGKESLNFTDALAAEEARLATGDPSEFRTHSYFTRGCYDEQLENWLSEFPREQILVLISEEFFARPQEGVDTITDFVGLPRASIKDLTRQHAGGQSEADPAVHDQLRLRFAPRNARLAGILGRDLPW